MWSCTAPNCENDLRKKKFFAFPVDKERRKLWTMRCNLTEVPSSAKICEDHFEKNQFLLGQEVKKLKPDAAPSLFLCGERNLSDTEFKNDKKMSNIKKEAHSSYQKTSQPLPSLFSNPVKLEKGKKSVICSKSDFITLNQKKEAKKVESLLGKIGKDKKKMAHHSEKHSSKLSKKTEMECKNSCLVQSQSPSNGSFEKSCSADSTFSSSLSSSSVEESNPKEKRNLKLSKISSVATGRRENKNQMHQTKDQLKVTDSKKIPDNVTKLVASKPVGSESLVKMFNNLENGSQISVVDIPINSSLSYKVPFGKWIETCGPMFVDRMNAVDQLIEEMLSKTNLDSEKELNSEHLNTHFLGNSIGTEFKELPASQISSYHSSNEVETSSSAVTLDDRNQSLESEKSLHPALASAKNYCYVQLIDFLKSPKDTGGIEFIDTVKPSSSSTFDSGVYFNDGAFSRNNMEISYSETADLNRRRKALVDKQRGRKQLSPSKKKTKPLKSSMNTTHALKEKKFINIHNQTFEIINLIDSKPSLSNKKNTKGIKPQKTARKCSLNVNYSGLDASSPDQDSWKFEQSKRKRQSTAAGGPIALKRSKDLYCDALQSLEDVGSHRVAKAPSQGPTSFTEYAKNFLLKTSAESSEDEKDVRKLVSQMKHWNEMLSSELMNLREGFKDQNRKYDLLFESEREKELENRQLRCVNEKLDQQVQKSEIKVSKYKRLVMELELKVSALTQPCSVRLERLEIPSDWLGISEQSKPSSSRACNDESRLDKKKQLKEKQIEFQNKLLKMLKIKNENKKIDLLIKEFEKEKENEQLRQRIRDLENENKMILEENEAMLGEVEHYLCELKKQSLTPRPLSKFPQKSPSHAIPPKVDEITITSSVTNSVTPSLKLSKPPMQEGHNICSASTSLVKSQLSIRNIPSIVIPVSTVNLNCHKSQLSVKNIHVPNVRINCPKSQPSVKSIPVSTVSLNCPNSQLPDKNIPVSTISLNCQTSQLSDKNIPAKKTDKVAGIKNTRSVINSVDIWPPRQFSGLLNTRDKSQQPIQVRHLKVLKLNKDNIPHK